MPASIMKLTRGLRRMLTTFCDLTFVSIQMSPSTTAYHMATRCGWPSGPTVAMVPVRLRATKSVISPSVMTI